MPTKPLDRLMFAQGNLCFFCEEPLPQSEASVEHLVASANGGGNSDDNCVACCKALNGMFGKMSLKEKIRLVLNQKGQFRCPNKAKVRVSTAVVRPAPIPPSRAATTTDKLVRIINDLHSRGASKPRTLKRLSSTISALFQKQLSEQELSSLLEHLQAKRVVIVNGTKVSYELPAKVA